MQIGQRAAITSNLHEYFAMVQPVSLKQNDFAELRASCKVAIVKKT